MDLVDGRGVSIEDPSCLVLRSRQDPLDGELPRRVLLRSAAYADDLLRAEHGVPEVVVGPGVVYAIAMLDHHPGESDHDPRPQPIDRSTGKRFRSGPVDLAAGVVPHQDVDATRMSTRWTVIPKARATTA